MNKRNTAMVNVGVLDRIVRTFAGLILIALPFVPPSASALTGLGAWIWLLPAIGVVLLATAMFRFCPAYTLLGVRTCSRP